MKKVIQWLDKNIELFICSILLCLLACFMMLQVICRYVLNNALSWPEELSCYIHIWYAMLGISYATKYGLHLRVDTVVNLFPQKIKGFFNILADIMLAIFYVYMIKVGIKVVGDVFATNQLSSAMKLPMWIVYASLLVGVALAIIRLVQKWYFDLKKIKDEKKEVSA
jgi:TRAP-type C4-dicarboxylate transport system permease small subunit